MSIKPTLAFCSAKCRTSAAPIPLAPPLINTGRSRKLGYVAKRSAIVLSSQHPIFACGQLFHDSCDDLIWFTLDANLDRSLIRGWLLQSGELALEQRCRHKVLMSRGQTLRDSI